MSTPNPNNLGTIIESARVRKIIYSAYVIAIVVIGAIQVGFAAISVGQPEWLTVALAVAAYLGVPVAGLAVANTSTDVGSAAPDRSNAQAWLDRTNARISGLTATEREADEQAAAARMQSRQDVHLPHGIEPEEISGIAENRLRRDLKGE